MSLTVSANSGGSTFIQVPPGMHLAMCYRIIDLGTQKTEYMGQVKHQPKVLFQFEVHGEDDAGQPLTTSSGEPLSVAKNFTLSLSEKSNLRKDLQTWRGKEFTEEELKAFDLKNVLGQWCMLSITHRQYNDKTYCNIENINPVPSSIRKAGLPDGHNEPKLFSIREADMDLFEKFSDYIKDKIKASPEWESWSGVAPSANLNQEAAPSAKDPMDNFEDDIPF
jgi:hypothetical protein